MAKSERWSHYAANHLSTEGVVSPGPPQDGAERTLTVEIPLADSEPRQRPPGWLILPHYSIIRNMRGAGFVYRCRSYRDLPVMLRGSVWPHYYRNHWRDAEGLLEPQPGIRALSKELFDYLAQRIVYLIAENKRLADDNDKLRTFRSEQVGMGMVKDEWNLHPKPAELPANSP